MDFITEKLSLFQTEMLFLDYELFFSPIEAVLMICPAFPAFFILSTAICVPLMTAMMLMSIHNFQPKLVLIPALLARIF